MHNPEALKSFLPFLLLLLIFPSCAGTNSVDAFYEKHKEDDQVLAFRVPPVMFSMLRGLSGDSETLISQTRDLRYIRLPVGKSPEISDLNRQVGQLTSGSYIEVFRKNDGDRRNLVAIRERGKTVRDIMVYTNNASHGSLLYIKGDFDPAQVRAMAQRESFGNLENELISTFGSSRDRE